MVRFRVPLALSAAVLSLLAMTVSAHAASPGEMLVDAPSGTQAVGVPFEVRVRITRADVQWAVYNTEVIYDPKVVRVNAVKPAGIANCVDGSSWANPQTSPTIVAACAFQTTQATGVTEIMEFECVADGSTALHLVTPSEDSSYGSGLLDENAAPIATDFVDATVTCGAGGPIETVPVPTNPPPPTDYFVSPGYTPPAGQQTPGVTSSAGAGGGTPGAGTTGSPSTSDTAPAGPPATRQAATSVAASASKTSAAQNATQTSSDSGMPAWLIAVIVVVVLGAAGGAGWLVLKRRGASGG